MKVASVVKMSQNALIGVAAFLLASYWSVKGEGQDGRPGQPGQAVKKPGPGEIWRRFPKFVLGFALVSGAVSLGLLSKAQIGHVISLRNWCFALAFVSIGLGFSLGQARSMGGRPVAVYFAATAFNTTVALAVAWVLFGVLGGTPGVLP